MVEQVLQSLGLSDKETGAYLALLELGKATVLQVAEKSGLKRPTCYLILSGLVGKGLASEASEGKKIEYTPTPPQHLLAVESTKLEQLKQSLPVLLGLASQHKQKPNVRFYTGKVGIMSIYEESLQLQPGSEILAVGHAESVEKNISKFKDWYIKRRIRQAIRMRAITPSTLGSIAVAKRDHLEMRQTRLLEPTQFTQDVEINIYKNRVSMVSLAENELIGMITESQVFAETHRQLFELLWQIAKPFVKR